MILMAEAAVTRATRAIQATTATTAITPHIRDRDRTDRPTATTAILPHRTDHTEATTWRVLTVPPSLTLTACLIPP